MRASQSIGHRGDDASRFTPGRLLRLEPSAQAGAVNEIRNQVNLIVLHADIKDRDDARMPEPGNAACLLQKQVHGLFGVAAIKIWHLDGNLPIELCVVTEIDRTEAASAQK